MCDRHLDPKQRVISPRNHCNLYSHSHFHHRADAVDVVVAGVVVQSRGCGEVPARTAIAVLVRLGVIILQVFKYSIA